MPSLPSPVLRALEGLGENSGRTVVVTGPPLSGKSRLLDEVRVRLTERHARVIQLKGSFRTRSVPFGALDGLREPTGPVPDVGGSTIEPGDIDSMGIAVPAIGSVPFLPDHVPSARGSRSGRGRGGRLLGQPVRPRSANEGDPEGFWNQLLPEFLGPEAHPVAILIDDATLFDPDSREFIVWLSRRARYRPFLVVMALDTSNPGYVPWEEAFLSRGDVDWVRKSEPLPDPREAHRLKAVWDDLPSVTQLVAGFVALLGGAVGEVVLSRVTRLGFPQLAEALLPATGVGLIKISEGKVTIPHLPWVSLTGDLVPENSRKEMHLEIANALSALSPEPRLARRIEVAHHYLAWFPGPMALRNLLEAAELSLQLLAFDEAEDLLREALECVGAVPPNEREALQSELRLLHARSLFFSGRLAEGENEFRDGVAGALPAGVPADTLGEWLEPLIVALRAIGPRPSLMTLLSELAERAHDARAVDVEVLLQAVLAEFHAERREFEQARQESHRAALLGRRLPEGHLQAVALLAAGLARIEGDPQEQEMAARFLRASRVTLGRDRRWELDFVAEDLEAHLWEVRGDVRKGRQIRERSLNALQRQKLLPIELSHRLAIVEGLLDEGVTKGVSDSLDRARTIEETLHLLPPSPALLRFWVIEGRFLAIEGSMEAARDRWLAVIDEPAGLSLPRLKAEALVRLTLLEYSRKRPEEAAVFSERLAEPATLAALPMSWQVLVPDLAGVASRSEHGGARLPPPETLTRRREGERRERARR
ncbi:MAG: ATP-binding protein [Thermoplasmata archaeon]|nr:ATP-binding protein [Thermoplasmata archaeon]